MFRDRLQCSDLFASSLLVLIHHQERQEWLLPPRHLYKFKKKKRWIISECRRGLHISAMAFTSPRAHFAHSQTIVKVIFSLSISFFLEKKCEQISRGPRTKKILKFQLINTTRHCVILSIMQVVNQLPFCTSVYL